jgi:hypothetical protein
MFFQSAAVRLGVQKSLEALDVDAETAGWIGAAASLGTAIVTADPHGFIAGEAASHIASHGASHIASHGASHTASHLTGHTAHQTSHLFASSASDGSQLRLGMDPSNVITNSDIHIGDHIYANDHSVHMDGTVTGHDSLNDKYTINRSDKSTTASISPLDIYKKICPHLPNNNTP